MTAISDIYLSVLESLVRRLRIYAQDRGLTPFGWTIGDIINPGTPPIPGKNAPGKGKFELLAGRFLIDAFPMMGFVISKWRMQAALTAAAET